MYQKPFACLLGLLSNISIAVAGPDSAWSVKDDISCLVPPEVVLEERTRESIVYLVYASISKSVPHKDNFYPSCSRFIRLQLERFSIAGLISGLGRFSRSHLPPVDPLFPSVFVDGVVKIYDPHDMPEGEDNPPLSNNGFTARPHFYVDCSESFRVTSVNRDVGRPDPSWGL